MPPGRSSTCSTCSPTPAARGCTSGIPRVTPPRTSSRATAAMKGFNVLHPMGWDAFGLPAEQYAIKTGQHPRATTAKTTSPSSSSKLNSIGFNYDWDREVNTTDPGYFRWTQWIFRLLYESWFNPATNKAEPISSLHRQRSRQPPGWRSSPKHRSTGVRRWARCWPTRKSSTARARWAGFPSNAAPMRQWMLRITAYAERLIDELSRAGLARRPSSCCRTELDRPQRRSPRHISCWRILRTARPASSRSHWTRKKRITRRQDAVPEGRRVHQTAELTVFTTRPDTLFGATYMVLSPEHPLVDLFSTVEHKEAIAKYRVEHRRQIRPGTHRII